MGRYVMTNYTIDESRDFNIRKFCEAVLSADDCRIALDCVKNHGNRYIALSEAYGKMLAAATDERAHSLLRDLGRVPRLHTIERVFSDNCAVLYGVPVTIGSLVERYSLPCSTGNETVKALLKRYFKSKVTEDDVRRFYEEQLDDADVDLVRQGWVSNFNLLQFRKYLREQSREKPDNQFYKIRLPRIERLIWLDKGLKERKILSPRGKVDVDLLVTAFGSWSPNETKEDIRKKMHEHLRIFYRIY